MENKEGRFYKTYMKMKRKICGLLAAVILVSAPVAGYREAEAAAIAGVLGGIALENILTSLLVTAGVTALGYTSIKNITSDKKDDLFDAVASNETVASALGDAEDYVEENSYTVIDGGLSYKSSSGYNLNGDDNGNLSIALNSSLIQEAAKAVKAWADSDANEYEGAEEFDTDGAYLSTSFVSAATAYSSAAGIDDFTYDGVYDELIDLGVSTSSALLAFKYKSTDSFYYVLELPINSYYISIPYSGNYVYVVNSSTINSFDNRLKNYSFSETKGWLNYLDSMEYAPLYSVSSSGAVKCSSDFFTLSQNGLDSAILCGYPTFYEAGYYFAYYYSDSSADNVSGYSKSVLTYDGVQNYISYNPSIAPSYEDGWSFTISGDDAAAITASEDLSAMIEYIISLSEELESWKETVALNQEEIIAQNEVIIEQNESILSAMNGVYSYTKNIAGNVAGILTAMGNIYTAMTGMSSYVKALPADIADSVSDTYPALSADIADAVAETFPAIGTEIADAISDTYPAIGDAVADAVADAWVFPAEVIDVAIELPGLIADAIGALTITVPDIVIPEIVIPEIAVPDVAVTLDPSFDITVENDFAGVEGYIYSAVLAVLTAVFVPDTDLTLERVGTIKGYFGFVDDIKGIASDFRTSVFGITPSPYLKIPIGSTTSDYDYGLGSYITIDISWYADYKEYGDRLILALVWGLFLWRLFVLLPGIINGTSGFFSDKPESHGPDLTVSGGVDSLPLLEDKHR